MLARSHLRDDFNTAAKFGSLNKLTLSLDHTQYEKYVAWLLHPFSFLSQLSLLHFYHNQIATLPHSQQALFQAFKAH